MEGETVGQRNTLRISRGKIGAGHRKGVKKRLFEKVSNRLIAP
jgi:hypothetical protein